MRPEQGLRATEVLIFKTWLLNPSPGTTTTSKKKKKSIFLFCFTSNCPRWPRPSVLWPSASREGKGSGGTLLKSSNKVHEMTLHLLCFIYFCWGLGELPGPMTWTTHHQGEKIRVNINRRPTCSSVHHICTSRGSALWHRSCPRH